VTGDRRTSSVSLPDSFAETARAYARGELEITVPRPAATVVLLRDPATSTAAAEGPQAYLLRRVATMAFAAGMFVFPGGSVDARDEELPDAAWAGPPPSQWMQPLSCDEPLARSLVCAAVRETFEESGVLLAGPTADEVVADTSGEDWEADRLALLDRSLSLAELLQRRGLMLRADLLRAWAHWVTPEFEPRRYDTRFFVAAMPGAQRTRDVGGESDRVTWIRPADALQAHAAGTLDMLPPTIVTLAELASYPSIAAVLDAGTARDVRPVLPKIVLGDDEEVRLLLPHHDGYPPAGSSPPTQP
jgi:8-oxo-dGTP pyrophosphatase MutT (NUDIX family)